MSDQISWPVGSGQYRRFNRTIISKPYIIKVDQRFEKFMTRMQKNDTNKEPRSNMINSSRRGGIRSRLCKTDIIFE